MPSLDSTLLLSVAGFRGEDIAANNVTAELSAGLFFSIRKMY